MSSGGRLSFPEGLSVNDGIDADSYVGDRSQLVFPTVDDLVKITHKKAQAVCYFKEIYLGHTGSYWWTSERFTY